MKEKKLLAAFLNGHNIPYTKLTGKTIRFSDLGRDSCVFITIHGWIPDGYNYELVTEFAQNHDFCINW